MKAMLATIAIALLCGCKGNWDGSAYPTKSERCSAYSSAYAAYQVISETRKPSNDEIAAAKAASAFLTIYCGWQKTKGRDAYGVEEILPPN